MHISLPRWWFTRKTEPAATRRIGLALSGGAVRGIAHLGVLEVLEREGIRADLVTGASAGSVVGALYCAGYPVEKMIALARDMRWSKVSRPCRPRLSLFDTGRLEAYLNELLEGKTFEQLDIPFAAMGVDIMTSEKVVMASGSVARAVRASCAVPGLFSPVEWGEHLLMDGGVVSNTPVKALQDMGADYTIAVPLSSLSARRPRPRNVFDVSLAALDTLVRLTDHEAELADCVICPSVDDLSYTDFGNFDELLRRGRRAAEAMLPQLRADLGMEAAA